MAILKVDTISGIGTEGPVFEGDIEFTSQNFLTLPKGDTTQRGRGRALILGGIYPETTRMETYSLVNFSGCVEFGTLSGGNNLAWGGALGSSTRSVIAGGNGHPSPSKRNDIDLYLTASGGTPLHFGELSGSKSYGIGGAGDEVRGTFAGGYTPTQINTIEYVSLLSGGLAVDFGDLSNVVRGGGSASNAHGGLG